ncbi:hypothetical protein N665_0763s0015 [Sinapis alba]|nr:hypothetical protein N665_0763s0015 [Sinapis alba]
METAVNRGGSHQNPSRKECRPVYPNGRDGELLEQIRSVSRRKGELQQQEVELRARMLAMEIHRGFEFRRCADYENAAATLQEQLREKERSLREMERKLEEKDRELQGLIARAQEMDALQSSTNHSLQAELQERDEQYNLLWLSCQRHFAELERLHMHKVQELQDELANLKDRGGSKTNFNGASQNSGNQTEKRDVDLVNPLHSFAMHQQENTQGPSPQVAQSVLLQQKAVPASSEMLKQKHVHPSHGVHPSVSSDAKSEYQMTANGQSPAQGCLNVQTGHGAQYGSTTPPPHVNEQEANGQVSPGDQNGSNSIVHETLVSAERNLESALLDERSLLACIVRSIPTGGRIRISSTLPNRLGKMLAPLQWHDYRKKYGELKDFVARHLELFVIEEDYIQVREGAHNIVAASASAAVGKVAASSSPNSVYVAMTPMAQSQGIKKNDKTGQTGRQSSDYMASQQRKL